MRKIDIDDLDRRARGVSYYVTHTLSNELGIPIKIDDATARLIAVNKMTRGEGILVCLHGKTIDASKQELRIQLE